MTEQTPDHTEALNRLTEEVERLNQHHFLWVQNSPWRVLISQFLRGLMFGLGSVLGATLLVSILAWWMSQFEFLPVIGDWALRLVEEIEKGR